MMQKRGKNLEFIAALPLKIVLRPKVKNPQYANDIPRRSRSYMDHRLYRMHKPRQLTTYRSKNENHS